MVRLVMLGHLVLLLIGGLGRLIMMTKTKVCSAHAQRRKAGATCQTDAVRVVASCSLKSSAFLLFIPALLLLLLLL